ncbi:MBL fold metallo-hydrolase [Pleionea sediminis]|uniref:MBL fold metallo-hydrolase n=1 Tax=Pleionea sediminis TaxID=2569479 RepID=UPI00118691CE|nr:MBL fold metallo-hydrolase [Pleionea sediminis]
MRYHIESFHHRPTGTLSHILVCAHSKQCAIIDPCYDFDIFSGRIGTDSADKLVRYVQGNNLECQWILETHAHADHLTSAQWIKKQVGGKIAIGEGIQKVQLHFREVFGLSDSFPTDGRQFDYLFKDQEEFVLGELSIKVIATPGHTNDSVSYQVEDSVFVGDTVFAPHRGSARCDFPGGDAATLYQSIQKIFDIGESTHLYLCHDYPGENEPPVICVTVADQIESNVQISRYVSLEEYVKKRTQRDSGLAIPKLLYPSIQVNINAGHLPEPNNDGRQYLKIPIKF